MLKLIYMIFKDYGLDTVQICVVGFFGWKLFTNHLKHLKDDILSIKEKVEKSETEINKMSNRVSKIEGKLS